MSNTLRVTVDSETVPITMAIREAAHAAPALLVLTGQVAGDLADQLGSVDAAVRFLVDLATEIGRPIGLNAETDEGRSQTMFVAPKSWSEQRLAGWVAARHQELESEFGAIAGVRAEGGQD